MIDGLKLTMTGEEVRTRLADRTKEHERLVAHLQARGEGEQDPKTQMIYNSQCISSGGHAMQVAKWGNSLAIRLPAAVVEALGLREGDQIEIRIAGPREFEVRRDRSREKALERLRRLRRPLPAGFTFDREEANER